MLTRMESRIALCTTVVLFLSVLAVSNGSKWSYSGSAGPIHWHKLFQHQCAGRAQSPIDLKPEETMYDPALRDFAIWYDPPRPNSKFHVKNNGHTLQVDLLGEFYVTNGGLPGVYKAAQFHFHWGGKSHHGSEHLVEGKASPLEMHLVTYNSDQYEHIGKAVDKQDGLAVLGTMFEITEEDNPAFESIIKAIKHVRDPDVGKVINLPVDSVSIRSILPADISRYYRYRGSLTTPGCFESVVWTMFDRKQTISQAQMKEFRTLLQTGRHNHHHNKGSTAAAAPPPPAAADANEDATVTQQTGGNGGDGGAATATDAHSRSRRSLTREERRKEHRAREVLTELGIKGNPLEEYYLEQAALRQREDQWMMADMPAQEPGTGHQVNQVERQPREDGKEPIVVKIQREVLVNNFRPVQPINGRIVYRSFKLREDRHDAAAATARATYTVEAENGAGKKMGCCAGGCGGGGDGAGSLWASVVLLLASLLLSAIFVL